MVTFESEQIIAADKPFGVLTVPSRMPDRDLRRCLVTELQKKLGIRLWPVHRLDFEVSGLVIFAKTAEAHRIASMAFESREIKKTYEAWTEGNPPLSGASPDLKWESKLVRGKKRTFEAAHGKDSITLAHYKKQISFTSNPALQWHVEPLTGRSHQIRFHLSHAGFPIVGDQLYGAKTEFYPQSIALRAIRLEFLEEKTAKALGLAASVLEVLDINSVIRGH